MKILVFRIKNCTAVVKRYVVLCFFTLISSQGFSQQSPSVKSIVDTTFIKIGEQLYFKINIEIDSLDLVVFPEGQTFSPLEMVEAYKIDTVKKKDRVSLQRIYALTQFDSGAYTLPRQKVIINNRDFFTDSLQINVVAVTVDTLAQKMYDIKSLLVVEKSNSGIWKIILAIVFIVLILTGIATLLYWLVFRKKPLTEEEKVALLPPFDRAILELKKLENSKYIIQDEFKQYYSELTDILRSYIEEDVRVSALESTTDELIEKLELLKDAGKLELEKETIAQFKKVLQTADLVKFAKSKPEISIAKNDRGTVEQIVIKTKEALPEPTEEELLKKRGVFRRLGKKTTKEEIDYYSRSSCGGFIFKYNSSSFSLWIHLCKRYYFWVSYKGIAGRRMDKKLLWSAPDKHRNTRSFNPPRGANSYRGKSYCKRTLYFYVQKFRRLVYRSNYFNLVYTANRA